MENWTKIKVGKHVKPIHFKNRKQVPLNIGSNYFVSFGNNQARRCILTEVIETAGTRQVKIDIPVKPQSKKGYIDKDGNVSHNWVDGHILYSDEIGLTPEEAVINEVSF